MIRLLSWFSLVIGALLLYPASMKILQLTNSRPNVTRPSTQFLQAMNLAHFSARAAEEHSLNLLNYIPQSPFPDLFINSGGNFHQVRILKNETPGSRLSTIHVQSMNLNLELDSEILTDPRERGRPFLPTHPLLLTKNFETGTIPTIDSRNPSGLSQPLTLYLNAQERRLRKLDLLSTYKDLSNEVLVEASQIISATSTRLSTANIDGSLGSRWDFHMAQLLYGLQRKSRQIPAVDLLLFLHSSRLFSSLIFSGHELMDMGEDGARVEIPVLLLEEDPEKLYRKISLLLLDRCEELLSQAIQSKYFKKLGAFLQKLILWEKEKIGLRTPAKGPVMKKSEDPSIAWSTLIGSLEERLRSMKSFQAGFRPFSTGKILPFTPAFLTTFQDQLLSASIEGKIALYSADGQIQLNSSLHQHLNKVIGLERIVDPIFSSEILKIWGQTNGQIISFESYDGVEWSAASEAGPVPSVAPDQELMIISDEEGFWYLLLKNGMAQRAWICSDGTFCDQAPIQDLAKGLFFMAFQNSLFTISACETNARDCQRKWILVAGEEKPDPPSFPKNFTPHRFLIRNSEIFLSDASSGRLFRSNGKAPFSPSGATLQDPNAALILRKHQIIAADQSGAIWFLSEDPSLEFLSRPGKF